MELFGGVNGRYELRLSFCVAALPAFLLTELFASLPLEAVPALGFCVVPAVVPRATDSPPLMRPPAVIDETWLCCIVCRKLAVCCWNDSGCAALLCTDPKKRSEPPLRIVEGAAARPLADKLACDGTTGRLPAICRAPLNCWRVAATAVTRPAPKRPALTIENALPMLGSFICATFENRVPACSGAKPPKRP